MRQMISQRVLAVLCAGALAGCASGRRPGHEDGSPGAVSNAPEGEGAPAARGAPATDLASVVAALGGASPGGSAEAGRPGALEVTVTFADAPPHLRRSPGRNVCGAARTPRVRVHTMGGVAGAVVYLRAHDAEAAPVREQRAEAGEQRADAGEQRAEAGEQRAGAGEPLAGAGEPLARVVTVHQCRVEPRVAVVQPGHTLAVINEDERRLDVRIDRIAGVAGTAGTDRLAQDPAGAGPAGAAPAGPEPAAALALPVVGGRADLRWPEPGVYRVAAAETDPGFVVVPGTSRAGVTSVMGQVRLAALPIGSYDVIVWHPPLDRDDGGAPLVEQAQVTIAPGQTSHLTIPLIIPPAIPPAPR